MTVRIYDINNQKLLGLFITICKDIKTDYTLLQERMLLHHLRSSHSGIVVQSGRKESKIRTQEGCIIEHPR